MAVKKFPATGWMPFRKVKNRKIRKYRLAKVKYSSLPEPKMPVICLGNSWNRMKATIQISVDAVMVLMTASRTRP